jgi:hypothetical protein
LRIVVEDSVIVEVKSVSGWLFELLAGGRGELRGRGNNVDAVTAPS